MAESVEDSSIFEEREELMVSPTGGIPTLRNAHFLKPNNIVTSITGSTKRPPSLSLSSECNSPVKASFNGWRDPQRKWKSWVDQMSTLHHSVWKKAGIYEAIMNSTYRTRKSNDLILAIAERWCSETNTFIFPWGEATITLEDMMILGGFSVLGSSVSIPPGTEELVKMEEYMKKARIELVRSRSQKAQHCQWLLHHMGSGKEFEHEAFLSLWLSRFVFPGKVYDTIIPHLFSIAIRLSRGTRIALAPAVLASIYRDLSLLKSSVSASAQLETKSENGLNLWAPLRFVQIWAWERFPPLRPTPNLLKSGEPRLARWHGAKRPNLENLRLVIDSSEESFQWRPYTISLKNWDFPKFYVEKEENVSVDMDSDDDFESFFRFLRACELDGIDCIEQYLPHRVSMQFGLDQDVPVYIPSPNSTAKIAWKNYCKKYRCAKLYIPPRLFESDVTTQYLEWWKQSPKDLIKGIAKRQRTSRKLKKISWLLEKEGGYDSDYPPGFPPKRKSQNLSSTVDNGAIRKMEVPIKSEEKTNQSEDRGNEGGDEVSLDNISICNNDNGGNTNTGSFTYESPVSELEDRISKLERVFARLKAARFGNRFVKNL